jgi:hypothetical protein
MLLNLPKQSRQRQKIVKMLIKLLVKELMVLFKHTLPIKKILKKLLPTAMQQHLRVRKTTQMLKFLRIEIELLNLRRMMKIISLPTLL